MWHWDQGRLSYFQFEALQRIASFVLQHDIKSVDKAVLIAKTHMPFLPANYTAWRNYSRALKQSLLVYERDAQALPTPVAEVLSQPGAITSDEYIHFLVEASTEPSPALEHWSPDANFRYPLLFSLKYLLMKTAIGAGSFATLNEIIGAYNVTGLVGDEDDSTFLQTLHSQHLFEQAGIQAPDNLKRQAKESLRVISQISYLHLTGGHQPQIEVSLDPEDAKNIFQSLNAISGPRANDRDSEILRLAQLFSAGTTNDFFDYPNTIVSDVVESGFTEGSKVKKTHITIERNRKLRKAFFTARPTAICDLCELDTAKTYDWTDKVLDLHHLLPLASGTRVEASGTTFDDLVPICPTCHRATHKYYDRWLTQHKQKDFIDAGEARDVYAKLKHNFKGTIHA